MFDFLGRREGIAVRYQGGDLAYEELNALILLLVDWMKERGGEPGDRIAVVLPNSLEFLLAYYACLLAGFVLVPINERLTNKEVGKILSRADPRFLITSPRSATRFEGDESFRGLPVFRLAGIQAWMEDGRAPVEGIGFGGRLPGEGEPPWPLEHPAVLFFTSGSTGAPKGALYSHRTLFDNERIYRRGLDISGADHSIVCHCMASNFMFSQMTVPFLNVGGTVEIVDFGSVEQTLNAIRSGATFLTVIPWFGLQLVEAARLEPIRPNRIRVCLVGGDRVPMSFHQGFREVFGLMPREMYGMTETNVFTASPPEAERIRPGSAGLLFPECQVEIRGADGAKRRQGEEGEIWARTPGRMEEYFRDPEKTADTIVEDWVATGDAGYFDPDGYLWLSGRIKQIIICDGDNIHPGEVERALAEHPEVEKVCVFGVDHEIRGETVAAAIVPVPQGAPVTLPQIEAFLAPIFTEVKIPKDLLVMDELPETAGGKLDRRAMVERVFEQRAGQGL